MLCFWAQIAQKVVAHSQSQAVGQMFVVVLFVVRMIVVQHIVDERVVLCTNERQLVVGNLGDRLFV